MMSSLVTVMRHLGMDHPPFPGAAPIVPQPSQPCNTSYDGVGPFGTYPIDTNADDDDADDDDEEDTKTESEGGEE